MSKVAAIQMCSSHQIETNLKTAEKLIEKAAQNGASLLVLPEMFAIMGLTPQDKIQVKESFGKGIIQDFLAHQAQKNNVWIVGGTIPIACKSKNKIRAACLVYDSNGNIVGRYDKKHLFDAKISKNEIYRESDTTEPGKKNKIINTPFGKLGIAICFDIRFSKLFIELGKQGAEIIAIPAAFTVKTGAAHWKLLTRSRATENFCYVIGAAQGGKHDNGRKTYGNSLIVDPWGKVIHECLRESNGIVYGDINLTYLKELRSIFAIDHLSN